MESTLDFYENHSLALHYHYEESQLAYIGLVAIFPPLPLPGV